MKKYPKTCLCLEKLLSVDLQALNHMRVNQVIYNFLLPGTCTQESYRTTVIYQQIDQSDIRNFGKDQGKNKIPVLLLGLLKNLEHEIYLRG